jgi:pimeloyl-ACP methyl ester carboxylesterase
MKNEIRDRRMKSPKLSLSGMLAGASLAMSVVALSGFQSAATAAGTEDRNVGQVIDVGGDRMNSVLVPRSRGGDLPPVVFIHGASTNLLDPVYSFRSKLQGRAELLFVDRPGYGSSQRGGPENAYPDGQADAIAALMEKRGIRRAIIVSHSFGGAVAASFALRHKDMVLGLVFLSPAVYPWPGGVEWYYSVTKAPVIGWLFATLVAPPAGSVLIDKASRAVFAPNHRPDDYIERTRAYLALRPAAFHNNAVDIANLNDYLKKVSPRYSEIKAPTVVITGDTDTIVSPEIHSRHLARAISGARLITIHNMGHKSDYVANDVAVAAIETVAGKKRDLQRIARQVEARIAGDHER